MQNKERIALFDFCETLANFQTADAFVKYVREHYGNPSMLRKEKLRIFLNKSHVINYLSIIFKHSSLNKRCVLWQLKGFEQNVLIQYASEYYHNIVKPNLIKVSINELLRLKNEGWRIVIVSAGYGIYINFFADDFCINKDDVIAVNIKFVNGICEGSFDGGDRLWDKVEKLNNKFCKSNIQSVAFSDSISDLPMLQWADEGIVIRRSDKKKWADKYNLEEIIWE